MKLRVDWCHHFFLSIVKIDQNEFNIKRNYLFYLPKYLPSLQGYEQPCIFDCRLTNLTLKLKCKDKMVVKLENIELNSKKPNEGELI